MEEPKNQRGKIVLALEKLAINPEERGFVPFEIPMAGPLSEIPKEIKELYYDEKILPGITRECGFKRVSYSRFKRFDSESAYVSACFAYPMKIAGLARKSFVLMWIGERKEWVAIVETRNMRDGFQHSYAGPFSLDDYCAEGIRVSYRIEPNVLSPGELIKSSPSELEQIGGEYERGCG